MATTEVIPVAAVPPPPLPSEPKLEDFEDRENPWEEFVRATVGHLIAKHQPQKALALVPKPLAAPGMTLYELEDQLAALIESTEMVSPEEEEAFFAEVQATLTAAVEKRDRVGQFLAHLEAQAALAAAETKRLQERKSLYTRMQERMEKYVVRVIQGLGTDKKGKYLKLEGKTVTFSVAKNPNSVDWTDESLVPLEYKTVTVTLPAPTWQELLDSLDLEQAGKIEDAVAKASYASSRSEVKAVLEAGTPVPGAKLVDDKYRLVRK